MYWTREVPIALMIGVAAANASNAGPASHSSPAPMPAMRVHSSDMLSTTGFSSADTDALVALEDAPSEDATESAGLCIFCGDYLRLLSGNVRHTLTSPARWTAETWRSVGVKSLAVVGAAALLDQQEQIEVDEHKSETTDRVAGAFEPFGARYAGAVIGGFLLVGALDRKPNAKAVAV
ncbi:MAG TPA: hypothetical protein VFV10_14685, partial [Gammaproteobacteria bacterium]|nr:hypothetical protein [Gammaproteobacteria bacterium]